MRTEKKRGRKDVAMDSGSEPESSNRPESMNNETAAKVDPEEKSAGKGSSGRQPARRKKAGKKKKKEGRKEGRREHIRGRRKKGIEVGASAALLPSVTNYWLIKILSKALQMHATKMDLDLVLNWSPSCPPQAVVVSAAMQTGLARSLVSTKWVWCSSRASEQRSGRKRSVGRSVGRSRQKV